jgi:hypothetical protein
MNEDMFIKENTDKPKKPKRKLTEKQLEGLAKGRAKMAEKRKMKKAITDKKKQLQDLDKKAEVENSKVEKQDRKAKKVANEKSFKLEDDFKVKKEKALKSASKFDKLKLKALEGIKTTKEMEEFEKIMKGVSKDMASNPEKLYDYLRTHADRLAPENQRKAYQEQKEKAYQKKLKKDKLLEKGKPRRKEIKIIQSKREQQEELAEHSAEHSAEQREEKKPNLKLSIDDVA